MDSLIGLAGFAFVTTVTPGPNNAMLLASGANFGLRGSLRHMAGIMLGFSVMVLALGAGLAPILAGLPAVQMVMQIAGILYVLWLAQKIAFAAAPGQTGPAARPLGLVQAAAFQWVNPKAWAMVLAALATYGALVGGPLSVALVFAFIGLPAHLLWIMAGARIARWLASARSLRIFNIAMAAALVLSMLPVIFGL